MRKAYSNMKQANCNDEFGAKGSKASESEKAKFCPRCKMKEPTNTTFGIYRNGLMPSTSDVRSIEKLGRRSPYSNSINDLRDELLRTKRIYALAIRDNSLIRTKLKIMEKECKRREDEIEELLDNKTEQSKYEERLQLNSLRKKVLQYERALRERNEENSQLLTDRNVAKAVETRTLLNKLEIECNRMKGLLSRSVPESEHLREKHQYMKVIDKLTEENMELRNIIGEYEKRRKEAEKTLEHVYGGADLIKEFRKSGIATKKQADFYKNALTSLVHNNRRLARALDFKNRSNSESGVAPRRSTLAKRFSPEATSLTNSASANNLYGNQISLPSIHSDNAGTKAQKRPPLSSKKPLDVKISTRGSSRSQQKGVDRKSIFSNNTNHRKFGKMSLSLDNPDFGEMIAPAKMTAGKSAVLPRMYQSISTEDEEMEDQTDETRTPPSPEGFTQAIIYGDGEAIELRNGNANNPSSTFVISERIAIMDEEVEGQYSDSLKDENEAIADVSSKKISENVSDDATNEVMSDSNKQSATVGTYLTNLEALKMEYYDAVEVSEERAEHEMENIIRAVQSHILRVKMLHVREQSWANLLQ